MRGVNLPRAGKRKRAGRRSGRGGGDRRHRRGARRHRADRRRDRGASKWAHQLASAGSSFAERQSGLPGWAALPSAVMGVSLLTAALGMYWDISLHIDNGRDDGPLANPGRYLILVGLYGSLLAGALSMALSGRERPCGRPSPSAATGGRRSGA